MAMEYVVIVGDREIRYRLERKSVKNLNLRIRKDGQVFVSANVSISMKEIELFLRRKAAYIFVCQNRFQELAHWQSQSKQYVNGETFYLLGRALRLQVTEAMETKVFTDGIYLFLNTKKDTGAKERQKQLSRFFDQQCVKVFTEIAAVVYQKFKKYGVRMPQLRIRTMQTRWGACLVKKEVITLNKRLIESSRDCIEYVIMHEFCHLIHPNHSKSFYIFLSMMMPDWRMRKQYLDKTVMNSFISSANRTIF